MTIENPIGTDPANTAATTITASAAMANDGAPTHPRADARGDKIVRFVARACDILFARRWWWREWGGIGAWGWNGQQTLELLPGNRQTNRALLAGIDGYRNRGVCRGL